MLHAEFLEHHPRPLRVGAEPGAVKVEISTYPHDELKSLRLSLYLSAGKHKQAASSPCLSPPPAWQLTGVRE